MNTPVSLQIIGGKNTATVFWMIKKKSTKFFERLWAQPTQYKFRLWILDLHKLTRKCPYSTSTARHVLSNRLCWTPTLCISKEIVALGCGSNNNVKVEHLQKGSRRLVRTGATGQRPLLSGRGWSVGSVSASRLRRHLTLAFSRVPSEQKITVRCGVLPLDSLVMLMASTSMRTHR